MFNLPQFLERAGTAVQISTQTGKSVKDVLQDMALAEVEEEKKKREEQAMRTRQLIQAMTSPLNSNISL